MVSKTDIARDFSKEANRKPAFFGETASFQCEWRCFFSTAVNNISTALPDQLHRFIFQVGKKMPQSPRNP
ncbi:MAG: hypothetical protein ACKOQ6_08110, partial [Bacteroidota bacterium]